MTALKVTVLCAVLGCSIAGFAADSPDGGTPVEQATVEATTEAQRAAEQAKAAAKVAEDAAKRAKLNVGVIKEDPLHSVSPYKFDRIIDSLLIGSGLVLWIIPNYAVPENADRTTCGSFGKPLCMPKDLNALDRAALGPHYSNLDMVSNIYFATGVGYLLFDMIDVGPKNFKSYMTDFGIMMEALVWNGVLHELVRRAVQRPRPYLYLGEDVYPDKRNTPEATTSFYSGHTSIAFTLATSFAYTYSQRHPHSKWQALVWTGSLLVATGQPILRVLSGNHFVTDVLAGAAIGSSVGLLVAAMHVRRPQTATSFRLVPTLDQDRVMIGLAGLF